jgi:hypothetical protein
MTVTTVKRSDFKTFLNTGTTETPVWSLIGEGITTGSINYNPQSSEEIYIHQDSGTTTIDGYKPTFPVEATAKKGDAAFDFVDAKRKARAVGGDAQAEIVNVWLYETEATGAWPAEKQNVNIQIDEFGGDGGQSAKINYTLNYMGDPVPGTFNPSTLAFVATP